MQLYRLNWWSRFSKEPRIDLVIPLETSEAVNCDLSHNSDNLQMSWWCKVALWICGLSSSTHGPIASEKEDSEMISLKEKPIWRNVCNVNAIVLLTVNVFLWGYWA